MELLFNAGLAAAEAARSLPALYGRRVLAPRAVRGRIYNDNVAATRPPYMRVRTELLI